MRQYLLEVGAFAEREKDLADVVLQVIVNSYMEKVQKWKGSERIMCEALRVLMADELNEERVEGQREGRIEGQREGRIEGLQEGILKGQLEGIHANIRTCKTFKISKSDTIKNVAKEFSLSEDEARDYVEKYW